MLHKLNTFLLSGGRKIYAYRLVITVPFPDFILYNIPISFIHTYKIKYKKIK